MKAGRALAALLQRGWAAAPHPSQQQPGALRQLQRGLSGGPFAGRAGGAAAAAPWLAAVAAGLAGGVGLQLYSSTDPAQCRAADKPAASGKGAKEFDKEEVAKHRTKETGIWVTYKDGVYDVTKFVEQHPGGAARLMLAAGGAIDPFWAMYQQHNNDQVKGMLEEYRIGRLKGGAAAPVADPYANEPARLPALIVRSQKPMNSETPKELLVGSLITPNELFYVRNHLPVPHVDAATYRLRVEGEGVRTMELSLEELQTRFRRHSVTATLQCTGNRRNDFNLTQRPVKGLEWDGGSISTAVWSGVRLRDVLLAAGLEDDNPDVAHIQFEGLDTDMASQCYGASVEVDKAMDPQGDVLLAFEMKGAPLPADHGYPVRVVVPGVAGCRSVKWLGKIVASDQESASFWQRKDYKAFSPSVDWHNVDWESAPAIQNMPVTSHICEPLSGAAIDDDEVTVKGYAWSGGGQGIIRVDVSADGGATWHTAELNKVPQKRGRGWAWALWEATVPLPKGAKGAVQLVAKATDESYNTQPEQAAPIWNLRGVNCNSWHRVSVNVQ
ncbi:hypothetical protein CHLNCDRAFT_30609 [Chlorella variabilis]|uniref:sulfite oxidase n=1 Tax=Chlorella variabilis TaxID=554065 RepID=E1ZAM5_CHLVA|nr:hypothetical protein CHLNCDRAFT_30609 [Chlorella variabilis]EFN57284.1 hypothetical protein CHLNCDRAFT_30609 [Chlorella variabilis]|eukprot:XP_005849386.1 hypothetical protein CHLNCDRAFT_30609 [Chlorella variabilis]